ncbi:MAG: WecB/TagA/CpsF family glycosyltransferase [Cyclobacteriaceae bacterium]
MKINSPAKEKTTQEPLTFPVLNSKIAGLSFEEALDTIFHLAVYQKSSYVCFANVHMVVEAYKNVKFQRVVNEADLAAADGLPISKYINFFFGKKIERVASPDMLPRVMLRAAQEGKSVYFYGSSDEVLQKIRERASLDFPGLKIAGTYAPPFRQLSTTEKKAIVEEINGKSPDFVFVCLGCPKQEQWMNEHLNLINSCMLGVGQAFGIYAGLTERAPMWMQKKGLEWAFRLYKEPMRLARRYYYTNGVFLYLVIKLYFGKMRRKELLPV